MACASSAAVGAALIVRLVVSKAVAAMPKLAAEMREQLFMLRERIRVSGFIDAGTGILLFFKREKYRARHILPIGL